MIPICGGLVSVGSAARFVVAHSSAAGCVDCGTVGLLACREAVAACAFCVRVRLFTAAAAYCWWSRLLLHRAAIGPSLYGKCFVPAAARNLRASLQPCPAVPVTLQARGRRLGFAPCGLDRDLGAARSGRGPGAT